MKIIEMPRNSRDLVFQGPQTIPKYTNIVLVIYTDPFGIFINSQKHLSILKLISHFIIIKMVPNFCRARYYHVKHTHKVS
jgi:hypothetical protein